MKYTHLGRSGVTVSRLCLGTMNLGVATDEAASFAIMDRALELGINFFDTADRYGNPQGAGGTEELIGRWLAQGGRRERIVLATKVFGPMGLKPGVNDWGLSAYHIRAGCEASLRRLQTDHVDLYQMHHIDRGYLQANHRAISGYDLVQPLHLQPGPQWDEIWQAMEQLVREGKTLYVGSSNFAGWNIAQANETAAARHLLGLVSEQSVYNLTNRMVELEVIPACRAYGVGLVLWSPLAGGLLAGPAAEGAVGRRAGVKPTEKQRAQLAEYEALCRELGEEPAHVALAWLLHQPVVSAPIIGPRTVAQLESAVHALEIALAPEVLARLDAIWPGPGPAPEAYAW